MTRGQKRRLFTRLLPRLIDEMRRRGYEAALSEGYVGDSVGPGETSPHRRDGGHFKGIAQDVNLYACPHVPAHDSECPDPDWLTASSAHAAFGAFWTALHPLCRWGGAGDGNHYSIEDGGVTAA